MEPAKYPKISSSLDRKSKPLRIVALGSSFAAGPGILPYADQAAGRSLKNYAHLLASKLPSAHLIDLTVSGATLPNILTTPQKAFRGSRVFPPQLTGFPPDADIITITGGGNDLNYIGGVTYEVLGASSFGKLVRRLFPAQPQEELPTAYDISNRFVAIVDEIHKQAPQAIIYLVEYLTIFGPDTKPGKDVSLSEDRIRHYQGVSETLSDAYRLAAEARGGVEVIPIMKLSENHGLGSDEPWVEGLSLSGVWERKVPFHPNALGMERVAEILYERIMHSILDN